MSDARQEAIFAVADVLLVACQSEKANLKPWKPFDVYQVAKACVEAYESALDSSLHADLRQLCSGCGEQDCVCEVI